LLNKKRINISNRNKTTREDTKTTTKEPRRIITRAITGKNKEIITLDERLINFLRPTLRLLNLTKTKTATAKKAAKSIISFHIKLMMVLWFIKVPF